ncbi:hypothetical protein M0802_001751 [Mischocyttarus mexicanus]|nr:hypothetical protein M0802_001751 [Mischocyttarus mexicanus]
MQTGLLLLRFLTIFVYLDHASTRDINMDPMPTMINFEPVTKTSKLKGLVTVRGCNLFFFVSSRRSRYYRRGYNKKPEEEDDVPDYMNDHDDHDDDDHHDQDENDDHGDMKAISQTKVDYWAGYYDFLINEGSYKFWAVFQLATAALLIYSGFAALYYAKVNPPTTDDDYDDIFRRRRRKRYALSPFALERPFSGLDDVTFQRILDAVTREIH